MPPAQLPDAATLAALREHLEDLLLSESAFSHPALRTWLPDIIAGLASGGQVIKTWH